MTNKMLAKMKANKDRVKPKAVDEAEVERQKKEAEEKERKRLADIKKYTKRDGEIDANANPYEAQRTFMGVRLPQVLFGKVK